MGSGAFLVAACLHLSRAYETASIDAGRCHPSDIGPSEQAAIRRTVAERCLYGVDLNPMAVQLARLSLWLATLAADRPLTFLDHHLVVGDSVLGTSLSSLRLPPATGRHRECPQALPLFDEASVASTFRDALPLRFSLETAPSDSVDQVRGKERTLTALNDPNGTLARWKRLADLWCAQWFATDHRAPATAYGALSDMILTGDKALSPRIAQPLLHAADAAAAARRFFHWELEFPEAFFEADGTRRERPGFDAIIGNPPWDMLRADSAAFGARAAERSELAAVVRFSRDAGIYHAQSDGQANRYQLFVERAVALAKAGGRIGLVLPSGMFADHGSARLRRLLFSTCDVDAVVGFDNRDAVFPIHRSVRFVLTTASKGSTTREIACRLGERSAAALEGHDDDGGTGWFTVRVTPALLERISGETLALPELRTPVDLAIAERAAALFKPLGHSSGWGASFGRELNVSDDRACLRSDGRGLPVIEGKHIEPFRVDVARCRWRLLPSDAERLLGTRYGAARLAYRDVASATNRLTLIAALLPAGCASTHTVFCLRTRLDRLSQLYLCSLLNSLVVNYLVRLRVTTHVTTAIVERLPIPAAEEAGRWFRLLPSAARVLGRRFDLDRWALLNAAVAQLYQLSRGELDHVLGTFPLIPMEERAAVARAFDSLGVRLWLS
jgi:hypothetical protein